MDPISRSPTNNDVVRETMIRTQNIARQAGHEYAIVTYDLAVATKAYSIQELEQPLFDNLLILLGNFHIELAFYGAVRTMINESGIEFTLTEAGVLSEGSLTGFIKGKFYNRCTRVHDLLANVLEMKLYQQFLLTIPEEELETFKQEMAKIPSDPALVDAYLNTPVIVNHLQQYQEYFNKVVDGHQGPMAQFWGTYIYLINRLHRELQRCVKTNDVSVYINIFPKIVEIFFALNRPNYSRWGMLFLHKLKTAHPRLKEILENGAFSIRRTKTDYSRSAIDLSLEQTVNKDAGSNMKGIVAFRNSDEALRRWALTMTQRALAVSEVKSFVGLEQEENTASQCRPSRVKKDNEHMKALSMTLEELCNPFGGEESKTLVNIATGQATSKGSEEYLITTLKRGEEARQKFEDECIEDPKRFQKLIKKRKIQNFATGNLSKKQSPNTKRLQTNAESLRDIFIRIIMIVAEKGALDLHHVLSYPITIYPLSLAHCDGSYVKTNKAVLLKTLESLQTQTVLHPLRSYIQIYDGGLLLHSVLSKIHTGTSYGSVARKILSAVCTGTAKEIHICLDKYIENSLKDSERKRRGAVDSLYVIAGPEQTIRQNAQQLLQNGIFKNELGKFLLREWEKDHHWNILEGKTPVASFGGKCYQYVPDNFNHITVTQPEHLQADHEEADTLIAFHIANISANNIIVRASDTDVLVILIGLLGKQCIEDRAMNNIIMDCGVDNNRRFISISNIVEILEQHQTGLSQAMPGYHALTGCDFTSAFYR